MSWTFHVRGLPATKLSAGTGWIFFTFTTRICVFMKGYEFVEHYRLEYQREENGVWFRYRDRQDEEVCLHDVRMSTHFVPKKKSISWL